MSELISPQELYAQLLEPKPPTVIDVRGKEAFDEGHIPQAKHIPADEVLHSLAQIPRDRPVVTY